MNDMNKININGLEYEIKIKEDLLLNSGNIGEVIYPYTQINIESKISESRKGQVLIHEMLHAIFYESGYEEQDEEMINRVGITLYNVLKNNDFSCIK